MSKEESRTRCNIDRKEIKKQLFDTIGDIDEQYIQEYIDTQSGMRGYRSGKIRLTVVLAAVMILLLGTVSLAAIPAIGHFLTNLANERQVIIQNFDDIEAEYAVPIADTQECGGLIATLNSAVVEDHRLLLSYTFDWSGLEEARDGSFHTYFLPWFFYITEGDNIICQSMYTKNLHTQTYSDGADEDSRLTALYCIDMDTVEGSELIGKELTVKLLYSSGGDGFVSTFTPESCFTGRTWDIDRTYTFGEHDIHLDRVQESALYVTLFIDCATIGHSGNEYAFVLSDELGNDYTVYPYGANDIAGYWFTKPAQMGSRLTLKVVRSGLESNQYGEIIDDSYEVLYEIPIELKTSFWK